MVKRDSEKGLKRVEREVKWRVERRERRWRKKIEKWESVEEGEGYIPVPWSIRCPPSGALGSLQINWLSQSTDVALYARIMCTSIDIPSDPSVSITLTKYEDPTFLKKYVCIALDRSNALGRELIVDSLHGPRSIVGFQKLMGLLSLVLTPHFKSIC